MEMQRASLCMDKRKTETVAVGQVTAKPTCRHRRSRVAGRQVKLS
jgi:hypothetical protein